MIAATDCDYRGSDGVAAVILFADWRAESPDFEHREMFHNPEPYQPGSFYRRELPWILSALGRVRGRFGTVIIDGYVWLAPDRRPGLGAHLFQALGETIPIIGVAKSSFQGSPHAQRILRGSSRRPLFITAAGIDPITAAERVKHMHGSHRIPTLLKRVDGLCREQESSI
jgi:deoxyribonuclease V